MNISSIIRSLCLNTAICAGIFSISGSVAAHAVTFKTQSVLSTGKWVRVNVSQDGIQQISYDQLRGFGLEPEKATVYGCGTAAFLDNTFNGDMPDDLVPTYSEHTPDGRLLFYGEGPAHYDVTFSNDMYRFKRALSTYSDYSTYFITDGLPAPEVTPIVYADSPSVLDTHSSVAYAEDEVQNPYSVGAFFWDQTLKSSAVTQTLHLQDFAKAGVPVTTASGSKTIKTATLCHTFMALVNNIFTLTPTAPSGWTVEGEPESNSIFAYSTRTVNGVGSYLVALSPSLPESELADYTFSYKSTPTPSSAIRGTAATDYRAMVYPRHNSIPASGQMIMLYATGAKGENVKISGAGSSTRVWNVSDLKNIYPYALSTPDASGSVKFSFEKDFTFGNNAERFVAFDANATHLTPEIAGVVANQNIHAAPVPDFAIITTEAFLPLAQELAQYHRDYLGQEVLVYTQQEIFNEFSSGAPAAMAYRRFAKMMYDRNPSKFRNLLLYGPGQWDNRQKVSKFNFELLLTYQTENEVDLTYATAYVADSYFGMLSDNFAIDKIMFEPVHIGVGRIPASSHSDAQSVNNKILKYLSNPLPPLVANSVLMVSDAGDETEHFKQSEQACSLLVANRPELTILKGHRAGFSSQDFSTKVTEIIKQSLTSGVALFGYSGHGNQDGFCWNKNLNSATSYVHPPFAMLSTCDPYCFHHLANSMAECMLYKEDGGAIGIVGAMCSVYLPYNQYYNLSVLDAWSKAKPNDTFGDIMVRAKDYMINSYRNVNNASQMFTNALCYNYCGDPALKMSSPDYGVNIEKVNGSKAPAKVTVYPRVPIELEGAVTNTDGRVNTNFNGTVNLFLYETPYIASTRVETAQQAIDYNDDRSLLAQCVARVENGRFKASLIAPQPQLTDAPSRLLLAAETDDRLTASGSYSGLYFGITDSDTPGQVALAAPAITDLYFNSPEYGSGSTIAPNSTMVVTVEAPAGLNNATSNIGYTMRVTIDGTQPLDRSLINISSDENNIYTASVILRDLTPGHHDITVSVADNSLKRADAAATFTVGEVASAMLTVDEEALPAREDITFNLSADNLVANTHRLVIENSTKETVFSSVVSFPYQWNLKDSDGKDLPEGFYNAYVISSGSTAASTPKLPVTVIR